MSTRAHLDRDFGGLVHGVPRRVVPVRSEDELVAALTDARRLGMPVTIRGAGHSCAGQTVSRDGMLVLNRADDQPVRVRDEEAEISGRARWRVVEDALHREGRATAVLADYLDLSVGGTVSVGGYGVDSVIHGAQVDHVARVRLVLPDGRAAWCSAETNAELFQFALAGLGQVGVIERVVMRTVPYRRFTTLFVYEHAHLADLIASLEWMTEAGAVLPDVFKAQQARGRVVSIYGMHATTWRDAWATRPPRAMADRRVVRRLLCPNYRVMRDLAVRAWLMRFGVRARLWSDYLLDHAGLRVFGDFITSAIAARTFAGCLQSVYIVAVRRLTRVVELPFEAAGGVNLGSSRSPPTMTFGVGLYSMIPRARPDLTAAVQHASAEALALGVTLGARPYLYGWHELSEDMRARLYGAAGNRLTALRRDLDPDDVFQPGTFRGRS